MTFFNDFTIWDIGAILFFGTVGIVCVVCGHKQDKKNNP